MVKVSDKEVVISVDEGDVGKVGVTEKFAVLNNIRFRDRNN